jgi:hypothetical protein
MAISVTQTTSKKTTSDASKTRNVYDNYDNLKSVVHYDANDNVEFVLKASNNSSGKSGETKKLYQVHVDVVQTPTAVSFDRATLNGRIYKNDGSEVNEVGFIYWTGDAEDNVIGKLQLGNNVTPSILKGSFSKQILNLVEGTTYNYRAYVKHENGTNYSKVYQFTTIPFSSVFSIAGGPNSGPAPLTVNLSAVNAGGNNYTFGWNMTGGSVSFQYSVTGITVTSPGSSYEPDLNRYTLNSIVVDLTGVGYDIAAQTLVLVNNVVDLSLSAEFAYNDDLAVYGISAVTIPAELSGFNVNTFTITFSSSNTVTEPASGTGSGNSYTVPREFLVLINNTPQPSLSVVNVYYEETDTYGISAIEVPSEIFGFTNSSRTVSISTNDAVSNPATATAQGGIQIVGDYSTQAVTHTYLSGGQYTAKAYAILGNQVIKEASKNTNVTQGTGPIDYSAQWSGVLGTYGNNVVGAYDFRNIPGSTLSNGLLAFWKLDDLTDSSGNGNNLTDNNGVVFGEPGVVGNCARTTWGNDGSYLTTDVATDGDASVSMWFRFDSLPIPNPQGYQDRFPLVIQKYPYLGIGTNSNYPRKLILTDLATWGTTPSEFEFTIGQWHHLVITFENSLAKVYVDNNLILETPEGRTNGINTGGRLLGWGGDNVDAATSYGTDIRFDSMGIWDRVLTEEEIEQLYNEGNGSEDVGKTVQAIVGPDLQLFGNTSVVTDTVYNNVSLLLHMDGSDNSTNFIDSSLNEFPVTVFGNAKISTTQQKFGTGSAYFDGTGDYLTLEDDADLSFNNGFNNYPSTPFTIEAWIYPTALGSNRQMIISKDTYGSNFSWCLGITQNSLFCFTHNINADWDFTVSASIQENTWQHVALTMDGVTQRLFLNGQLLGSKNAPITNASSKISIGSGSWNSPNTDPSYFTGYIDELRVTKGVALYTANFTPATEAFTDDPGTPIALRFTPSPAYAASNETVSTTFPHTLVLVAKADSSSSGDVLYMASQPIKWSQTGDQTYWIFSRTWQGVMPYNGNDNQFQMLPGGQGFVPDGSEWFYIAYSFLNNSTVRYYLRTPSLSASGTLPGATSQNFNGYTSFGRAGGASDSSANINGDVRLGMFINRAFSTEQEMNTLFAAITSGPVTDIDLTN